MFVLTLWQWCVSVCHVLYCLCLSASWGWSVSDVLLLSSYVKQRGTICRTCSGLCHTC